MSRTRHGDTGMVIVFIAILVIFLYLLANRVPPEPAMPNAPASAPKPPKKTCRPCRFPFRHHHCNDEVTP